MGVTRGSHARPEHVAEPSGDEARRARALRLLGVGKGRWRVATPVVVLVCGGLLAVSAVNSHGTDLRPGRYTDMATLVQTESDRYKALEARVGELNGEVDDLTKAMPDSVVRRAQKKVERLRDPAGLTPRSGAGVKITLSDAPDTDTDDSDLNPNLLVVHQQDIQAVVNALWEGGATAVTIAGQRIVSTTGIKCSGSTVQLQGVPYPQPYVIEAVGDPEALTSAIDDDAYLTVYREQAQDPEIGIGWEFQTESVVTAPAYDGLVDLHYAKPLPANG